MTESLVIAAILAICAVILWLRPQSISTLSGNPEENPELNWRAVRRATGLVPRVFQWCTAPALSALLMGLVINLLFQVLQDAGLGALPAILACLTFGIVLYLAALSAQGIWPGRLFRLRKR